MLIRDGLNIDGIETFGNAKESQTFALPPGDLGRPADAMLILDGVSVVDGVNHQDSTPCG